MQFGNFCRGAKLITGNVSSSDIDRIFLRSVRVLPQAPQPVPGSKGEKGAPVDQGLGVALARTGIKVSKPWRSAKNAVNVTALLTKGQNLMSQGQFVSSLIRIAAHRSPEPEISLADKLMTLCQANLHAHAFEELQLVDDEFSRQRFRTRAMGAALAEHQPSMKHVFECFARGDTSTAAAKRAMDTMNVLEANQLCVPRTSQTAALASHPRGARV